MEAGVVPLVNALEKKLLTGAEKNTHANSINTHSGNNTARVAFNLKLLEVLPPPHYFFRFIISSHNNQSFAFFRRVYPYKLNLLTIILSLSFTKINRFARKNRFFGILCAFASRHGHMKRPRAEKLRRGGVQKSHLPLMFGCDKFVLQHADFIPL